MHSKMNSTQSQCVIIFICCKISFASAQHMICWEFFICVSVCCVIFLMSFSYMSGSWKFLSMRSAFSILMFFISYLCLIFIHDIFCAYVYVSCTPIESIEEHQIPWNKSCWQLWATMCVLGIELGFLKNQLVLLTVSHLSRPCVLFFIWKAFHTESVLSGCLHLQQCISLFHSFFLLLKSNLEKYGILDQ